MLYLFVVHINECLSFFVQVIVLAAVACLAQTALGNGWAVAPYVGGHYAGGHYAGGHYAAAPYVGAHYAGYYPGAHYYGGYAGVPYNGYYGYAGYHGQRYHGPLAVPIVLPNGFLADTPEVAAAKGAHLTAVAHAKAATGAGYAGAYGHGAYGHGGYHGPLALPVVLPSGYLADTPEVAAAKGAHFSAVAHAASAAHYSGYGHGYGYGYGYHH